MSYEQFMRELGGLLTGVPEEEREEALQYYSDYFADAGKENEEEVLRELGSPEKVAVQIRAGLKGGTDSGEFTERGYMDEQFVKKNGLARREAKSGKKEQEPSSYQAQGESSFHGAGDGTQQGAGRYSYGNAAYGSGNTSYGNGGSEYDNGNAAYGSGNSAYGSSGGPYGSGNGAYENGGAYNNGRNVYSDGMGGNMQGNTSYGGKKAPWTSRGLKILMIALIVICAFPVVVPVVLTIAGLVFGLVCAAFGIFLALVICAGAIAIAGFALACEGLGKLFFSPPAALLMIGLGLVIFVIGLIAAVAAIRLCMIIFPALFRFFVGLCRKPFQRKAA